MFYKIEGGALDQFAALTARSLARAQVPLATDVVQNVPVYDMDALRGRLDDPVERRTLMSEWAHVLGRSAGVVVLKSAYADLAPIDAASAIFERIIAREAASDGEGGDHFATAGANARIWNALQKLCVASPSVFAAYFANPAISAICEAWLGPGYQMTAQVNLVRPGGQAQNAHRDYHLGFLTPEAASRFPAHLHGVSPCLTLQGAIAHCDMPVESGPTQLLPFSQLFPEGYLAMHRQEFRDVFAARAVQLPLAKGDAVFFNPALFHAAGENRTADIHRMANLLQVSCAFGRAMESIDRVALCKALYPVLQEAEGLSPAARDAAIAAAAEGYAFPTNLDTDPPRGGLAPETQGTLMRRALRQGMSAAAFESALDAQAARQRP